MSGFDYSALLHRRPFVGCAILINSTWLTILSKLGHHLINIGLSRLASVPQLQLSVCECLSTNRLSFWCCCQWTTQRHTWGTVWSYLYSVTWCFGDCWGLEHWHSVTMDIAQSLSTSSSRRYTRFSSIRVSSFLEIFLNLKVYILNWTKLPYCNSACDKAYTHCLSASFIRAKSSIVLTWRCRKRKAERRNLRRHTHCSIPNRIG